METLKHAVLCQYIIKRDYIMSDLEPFFKSIWNAWMYL